MEDLKMKKISFLLCALSALQTLSAQAKTGIECMATVPGKCQEIFGTNFSTAKEPAGNSASVWVTFIVEINCKVSKTSGSMLEYETFLASYEAEAAKNVQFYLLLPDQIKFRKAAAKEGGASLHCYFANPK